VAFYEAGSFFDRLALVLQAISCLKLIPKANQLPFSVFQTTATLVTMTYINSKEQRIETNQDTGLTGAPIAKRYAHSCNISLN
jgi:hypothetical protein